MVDGKPGHLGQPARHQEAARVLAEPQATDDAGGDRDDVLEGAAQLHADHVVVRVHAKAWVHERALGDLDDLRVVTGDDGGRRQPREDLRRDVRTAQHAQLPDRRLLPEDRRDGLPGLGLETLDRMHDDLIGEHEATELPDHVARGVRGHHHEHEAGPSDGRPEIVRRNDRVGERHGARVAAVRPVRLDLAHGVPVAHPQADAATGHRAEVRQRGTPAPAAEDRELERAGRAQRRFPFRARGSRNVCASRP